MIELIDQHNRAVVINTNNIAFLYATISGLCKIVFVGDTEIIVNNNFEVVKQLILKK